MSLVICSFGVYTTNYCIILLELFSLLSLAVAPRGEAQSSGELDQQSALPKVSSITLRINVFEQYWSPELRELRSHYREK